ncbi:MAG TPA: biopolymer transporter ExbD [Longimicrobiales bacterium]|nr:biopolymer transporter ExbD [Longimicrobiales bacterium]
MLHRRSRHRAAISSDINLTNLIDVSFVLLIIFMITAPILQGGVEVQLPKAAAAPITSQEGVIVSVRADGAIYIGDVAVRSLAEFERVFPSYMRQQSKKFAYLKGDVAATHGRVMEVVGIMKKLDVAQVGFVVEPEEAR